MWEGWEMAGWTDSHSNFIDRETAHHLIGQSSAVVLDYAIAIPARPDAEPYLLVLYTI